MTNYNSFVARHGEHGVQAIIEGIERLEGIKIKIGTSLEDRWNYLMQQSTPQQRLAA